MNTKLAENMKLARELRGWTQQELAERSGVNQATISRVEAGVHKTMKLESVCKLADVFGITTQELLYGDVDRMVAGDGLDNVIMVSFGTGDTKRMKDLLKDLAIIDELRYCSDDELRKELWIHGDERWEKLPEKDKIKHMRKLVDRQREYLKGEIKKLERVHAQTDKTGGHPERG